MERKEPMSNPTGTAEKFAKLNVWSRRGARAPHKPLLVLYALGEWQRKNYTLAFEDIDQKVGALLQEFGPPHKTTAVYPFCRLENDGVWEVDAPDNIVRRGARKEPLISELRRLNSTGSFTRKVLEDLNSEPSLLSLIANNLLDAHFQRSLHEDILNAVGLRLNHYLSTRRKRDSTFRPRVLVAYEYRCAICGFDARMGSTTIALDAAHIMMHQAGGPDTEENGLALCAIHHKTFDYGAFTIDDEQTVLISDRINGSQRTEEVLHAFHGTKIRDPQRPEHRPAKEALQWHRRQVFKGQPRHLG